MAKKSRPATNVFGGAPIIMVPSQAQKSRIPTIMIEGLQDVASLNAVIVALQAVFTERLKQVKRIVREHFIVEGMTLKRRPSNFNAVDGIGTASCQLKINSNTLPDDAVALFKTHGIPLDRVEQVAPTFVIGTSYANDSDFVQTLERLFGPRLVELEDARGPIIYKQIGAVKTTVSRDGLNEIFGLSEELVEECLPLAFTLAVHPKLETGGDLRPALTVVQELLGSALWQDIAARAATDPEALAKTLKQRTASKKRSG